VTQPGDKWRAAEWEERVVSDLKGRKKNPRQHSLEQIEQIVASIRKFGWTIPILIDDENTVLAGHGRLMAARLMGMDRVKVVVARGWSEEDKRLYVIADNKIALNSDWDDKLLKAEFHELSTVGADLGLTGFDSDELKELVMADDKKPEDEKPDEVTMTKCPTCGRYSQKH
jgi:ParB-like chromosome segregation protein Spo0J